MKKYLLLPVMAFVLCLVACSSDSDDAPNEEKKSFEEKKSLVGTWSASSGDGGATLYFSFKENGECTYDEVSYYNDYEIARAYLNYSYNAEDEMLFLTLKYIEDPDLSYNFIIGMCMEPGDSEERELRFLSDDKFIVPGIFRYGAVFTRM